MVSVRAKSHLQMDDDWGYHYDSGNQPIEVLPMVFEILSDVFSIIEMVAGD